MTTDLSSLLSSLYKFPPLIHAGAAGVVGGAFSPPTLYISTIPLCRERIISLIKRNDDNRANSRSSILESMKMHDIHMYVVGKVCIYFSRAHMNAYS